MFDAYQGISRGADADKLVQFNLDGGAVPVLRILYEKNHKERYNRGARIDDELPCIGKPKRGPLTAHTITTAAASIKVDARPAAWEVRFASSPKNFVAPCAFSPAALPELITSLQ